MLVMKRVFEQSFNIIMTVDKMQFSFMVVNVAIDAEFILQENYQVRGEELHVCFMEKVEVLFRRLRKLMVWAMPKNVAKSRVRVEFELLEKFHGMKDRCVITGYLCD